MIYFICSFQLKYLNEKKYTYYLVKIINGLPKEKKGKN